MTGGRKRGNTTVPVAPSINSDEKVYDVRAGRFNLDSILDLRVNALSGFCKECMNRILKILGKACFPHLPRDMRKRRMNLFFIVTGACMVSAYGVAKIMITMGKIHGH